jgi:hypothetical protein
MSRFKFTIPCVLLIFILTGCASFQPPKVVNVPVQVKCVTHDVTVPDYTFKSSEGKSLGEQVRSLLIDRELSIGYEARLRAIIEGCS